MIFEISTLLRNRFFDDLLIVSAQIFGFVVELIIEFVLVNNFLLFDDDRHLGFDFLGGRRFDDAHLNTFNNGLGLNLGEYGREYPQKEVEQEGKNEVPAKGYP